MEFLEGFEHVLECLPDCFCRSHGLHTSPLSQQVETQVFILEFVVQRLKGPWNLGDIILSKNYMCEMS